jgi:hypothetical protein
VYYELRDRDGAYKEPGHIETYPDLPDEASFNVGRRIEAQLPTPLRFGLDPEWGRDLMLIMGSRILLMRKDLIAALQEAGVDNLDLYDAVIANPYTGRDVLDYQAVNIIGLVAAADLSASDYESFGEEPEIDAIFGAVVIDEARARGALMFRMEESVMTVMVHERVKKFLQPKFASLLFISGEGPPED